MERPELGANALASISWLAGAGVVVPPVSPAAPSSRSAAKATRRVDEVDVDGRRFFTDGLSLRLRSRFEEALDLKRNPCALNGARAALASAEA